MAEDDSGYRRALCHPARGYNNGILSGVKLTT